MNMHHLISDDRIPPMISHEFIVMKLLVADSIVMPIVEFVTRLSEPFRISCWCHQISVNRLCVALVILPSLSMLSHTLQKTLNFSSLVRVSAPSHSFMILIMYALEVIILRGVIVECGHSKSHRLANLTCQCQHV